MDCCLLICVTLWSDFLVSVLTDVRMIRLMLLFELGVSSESWCVLFALRLILIAFGAVQECRGRLLMVLAFILALMPTVRVWFTIRLVVLVLWRVIGLELLVFRMR